MPHSDTRPPLLSSPCFIRYAGAVGSMHKGACDSESAIKTAPSYTLTTHRQYRSEHAGSGCQGGLLRTVRLSPEGDRKVAVALQVPTQNRG